MKKLLKNFLSTAAFIACCGAAAAQLQPPDQLKAILEEAGFPSTAEELYRLAPTPTVTAELQQLFNRTYYDPPSAADRKALADLLEFAGATPRVGFRRNWSKGFDDLLPELRPIRAAANFNLERADEALKNGEYRLLPIYLNQNYNLGSWCYDDPNLISLLFGIYFCDSTFFELMEPALATLTTGELESIAKRLTAREAALKKASAQAMNVECAQIFLSYRAAENSPETLERFYKNMFAADASRTPGADELRRFRDSMPELLKYRIAASKYAGADEFERHDALLALKEEFPDGAGLLKLDKFFKFQTEAIARLRCLNAAVEAELYRRENGNYPNDVSGVDPFTGQPLEYVKGDRIYSVGADLIDDSGGRNGNDAAADDIVFHLLSGNRSK